MNPFSPGKGTNRSANYILLTASCLWTLTKGPRKNHFSFLSQDISFPITKAVSRSGASLFDRNPPGKEACLPLKQQKVLLIFFSPTFTWRTLGIGMVLVSWHRRLIRGIGLLMFTCRCPPPVPFYYPASWRGSFSHYLPLSPCLNTTSRPE